MKKLYCFLILFILSVGVFAGTGTKGVINNSDTCFPLFPKEELGLNLYTWYSHTNFGESNYLHLVILPSIALKGILDKLGLAPWLINRLWFVGALFFMGASIFYFTSIFFKNEKGYIPRLISAIFFMLNPYVFNRLSGGQIMILWELASIVYMFGFFIKGLENPSQIHKYAILFAIASLFNGIVVRMLAVLLFGLYLLWHAIFNINKPKTIFYSVRFVIESIILVFALNCFWIIPVIKAGASDIISGIYGSSGDWNSLIGTSPFIRIIWTMRLVYGLFAVLTPYPKYLISPCGISVWLMLVIFIYSGVFFRLTCKKEYFFYFSAIIATYFATGLNYHFSSIVYTWFWNHIRPFQVLRNPEKFQGILLLSYAILLCITCREIGLKLSKYKLWHKIFYFLIIILISANSWVFFTGDLLGEVKPVEIPKYYYGLREYLKSDKYIRLVSLPIQWLLYNYSWAPYCMGDVLFNVSPVPVINKTPGENLSGIKEKLLYDKFYKPEEFETSKLLGLCNVRYILLQDDLYSEDAAKIKENLDSEIGKEYKDKKIFGRLNLYEVSSNLILPYIYTNNKANWILSAEEEYGILSYSQIFSNKPILIFSKNLPKDINGYRLVIFNRDINESIGNEDLIYVFQNEENNKKEWQFYIPKEGNYLVKGRLKPHFYAKKYVKHKDFFRKSSEMDNWDCKSVNSVFKDIIDEGYLKVSCFFDGDNGEDEYVQFKRKIEAIELTKYPLVGLYYKIDNPEVQTIELVVGLDFNLDNDVDAHIRGLYPALANINWDWYELNVLKRAKELYPDKAHYRAIEVEFYPHKLWGVDCSKDKENEYAFYIKELSFYRKGPKNYISNSNGELALLKRYVFSRDIYEIDGKSYCYIKKFLDKQDAKSVIFEEKTYLAKGAHRINFNKDNSFNVEWIMIELADFISNSGPAIEFEKVNPTKYKVKVQNIKESFWLIFNEAFHNGWHAFIKEESRYRELLNHYRANGYANVWYVNRIKNHPDTIGAKIQNEKLEIIIEFMPQRWFKIGSFISVIGLLGCCFYIIRGWFRRHA